MVVAMLQIADIPGYIWFSLKLIDGTTPALEEAGGLPQININGVGWSTNGVGPLESVGFGNYRAALDPGILSVGTVIYSRYQSAIVPQTAGETIEVKLKPAIVSYIGLDEADEYFARRLNSTNWWNAALEDRTRALIKSSQLIDALAFSGDKTDPGQLQEFPRYGQADVPEDIKVAQAEIAIALFIMDMEQSLSNLQVQSAKYSSITTRYFRDVPDDAIRAGIPSRMAWLLLRPYLAEYRSMALFKV